MTSEQIGRLEAHVENLQTAEVRTLEVLRNIDHRLSGIERALSEQRGARKVMVYVGTACGAIAGAIASSLQHWLQGRQ